MYCVSDPYLISIMLLRSAKKGASGKAATNNVTNPYWITKTGGIAAIDYFCITIDKILLSVTHFQVLVQQMKPFKFCKVEISFPT